MNKKTKKGFTLVELLVVIAILAILSTVSVVGYTSFINKAKESNAKNELHQVVNMIHAELVDDGKWEFVVDNTTYTVKLNNDKTDFEFNGVSNIEEAIELYPDFKELKKESEGTFTFDKTTFELSYKYGEKVSEVVKEKLNLK